MTGDEHYREAERLIEIVKNSEDAPVACGQMLAEAQVHATLAQAAATWQVARHTDYRLYGGHSA